MPGSLPYYLIRLQVETVRGISTGMGITSASVFRGATLRHWRERRSLSELQLAARAHVDPLTIKLLEADATKPRRTTLAKLAKALRVTVEALCNGGAR